MKDEITPFENIYIKWTAEWMRIKVIRRYRVILKRWNFSPEVIYWPAFLFISFLAFCLFASLFLGAIYFPCMGSVLGLFLLSLIIFYILPDSFTYINENYLLTLSRTKIEFEKNKDVKTFSHRLSDVELRRDGYDEDEYSTFTLDLVFTDYKVPTLARLSKDESKYLEKIIRNYMQLGDELFYPASMDEEQKSSRS